MTGDATALGQDFDRAAGDAQLDLLAHQRMRHTVVVPIVFDVVVDIDAGALPLGHDEAGGRQRPQVGRIELLEGLAPAAG